jgi:hypothetical protein
MKDVISLKVRILRSNLFLTGEYFLYVEFSDFYVNQSLAGQTIVHLQWLCLQIF